LKNVIHRILLYIFRNINYLNKLIKTLPSGIIYNIKEESRENLHITNFEIIQDKYIDEISNIDYNIANNNEFAIYKQLSYPEIFTCTFNNVIACTKSGFIIDCNSKKVFAETNPYKEAALNQYDFYYSLMPTKVIKIKANNAFFLISTTNYCHWFSEFLPILINILKYYKNHNIYITKLIHKWQSDSIKMLDINLNSLIQINSSDKYIHFDKLNFISFGGIGAGIPDLKNIIILKNNLIDKLNAKCNPKYSKIYISRKQANHRKVVNEKELEAFLYKRGFISLCMEDYSVQKQLSILKDASLIIAVHGPALINTIVTENSNIIELANDHHITASFFRFATVGNNKYFLIKCQSIGEPKIINNNKFYGYCDILVDINKLGNIIYSIENNLF